MRELAGFGTKTYPNVYRERIAFALSLPVTDSYGHSRKISSIVPRDRILAR
jgi:hypothetical protein